MIDLEYLRSKKLDSRSINHICVLMSILGLLIIWFAESSVSMPSTAISEITESDSGRYVKLCGTVDGRYTSKKGTLFFSLDDGSRINVVRFYDNTTDSGIMDVEEDEYLCIEGNVDIYQGELELIAEKFISSSRE